MNVKVSEVAGVRVVAGTKGARESRRGRVKVPWTQGTRDEMSR